jgi:hypothetical protein
MIDKKEEKAIMLTLTSHKELKKLNIQGFKELKKETLDPPRKMVAFVDVLGELTQKSELRAVDGNDNEVKILGKKVIDITRYEGTVGENRIPVYLFEQPGIYELRVYPPPQNYDELYFHKFATRDDTLYYLTHILAATFLLEPGWLNFSQVLQGAGVIPKLSASGELSGSQILFRDAGVDRTIVIMKKILGINLVANVIGKISGIILKNFSWTEDGSEKQTVLDAIKWVNEEEWNESKKYAKLPLLPSG